MPPRAGRSCQDSGGTRRDSRGLWVPRPGRALGERWPVPHGGPTWGTVPGQAPGECDPDPRTCAGEAAGFCSLTSGQIQLPPEVPTPLPRTPTACGPGMGILCSPRAKPGMVWQLRQGPGPPGASDLWTRNRSALPGLSEARRVEERRLPWWPGVRCPGGREPPPPAPNKEPFAGPGHRLGRPLPPESAGSVLPTCYSRRVPRRRVGVGRRPPRRPPRPAAPARPPAPRGLGAAPTWWEDRSPPGSRPLSRPFGS